MKESEVIENTKQAILQIRGQNVILDKDVAIIFGEETKTINQRANRNPGKFPEDFRFQLSEEEFDGLRSQFVTSKRGGRRYLPFVYTEHGVLQIANLIRNELADRVSVFVIRAFVEMRSIISLQEEISQKKNSTKEKRGEQKLSKFMTDIGPKLQQALNNVMDTVVDSRKGTTIREEGQDLIQESISHLKERLKKTGLENEEIVAKITKLLAEAEKDRALARKTNVEADQLEFLTMVRKLKLVLEAQKLYYIGEEVPEESRKIDAFLSILKNYE